VHYPTRNLVDVCWHARPPPSLTPIYAHEIKYAGVAANEKLARVAAWLGKRGSAGNAKTWPKGSAYFVSELDEVAWLLNLRGGSFAFTRESSALEAKLDLLTRTRSAVPRLSRHCRQRGEQVPRDALRLAAAAAAVVQDAQVRRGPGHRGARVRRRVPLPAQRRVEGRAGGGHGPAQARDEQHGELCRSERGRRGAFTLRVLASA
jgi:hypothetical protein